MESSSIWLAFGLTLFAGLSTGIGSAIAFFAKKHNTKLLALALGFSAGVMIYVSFVELLAQAFESLTTELGEGTGEWITALSFFGGIALIGIIDKLVPEVENPHEIENIEVESLEPAKKQAINKGLMRVGLFTALSLAIHNFPEGIATFIGALNDISLGIPIAIAIAIHNIPEGIAVSMPIYYATHDRKKAFWYSFLSGLAEPAGALIGFFILMPFLSETLFGVLFAAIAGIMVFISLDQLLPTAEKFGEHHHAVWGLVFGMFVMALSLLLL